MEEMSEEERWYAYGNENGDGPWNDDKDEDEDDEVSIIPCQNCDAPLTPEQARHGTLFCSEKCQQTAKAIRYGRATLRDGRYQRALPDPHQTLAIFKLSANLATWPRLALISAKPRWRKRQKETRSGLVSEPHSRCGCVMTRSSGMSYRRKLPQSSEREPEKQETPNF